MNIIEYDGSQAREITDLFYQAVHNIDSCIYTNKQKEAWATTPIEYDQWKSRLDAKKPYLLMINNEVAGFIELEIEGHIDCAYVRPKYQRMGVATALIKHVIYLAKVLGLRKLTVEASTVAKPVFKKLGFIVENKNEVIRYNTVLINYSMSKILT
jgi:putative acetyltransferase